MSIVHWAQVAFPWSIQEWRLSRGEMLAAMAMQEDIRHRNTSTNMIEDDAWGHSAHAFGHRRACQTVHVNGIIQIIRVDGARAAIDGPIYASPRQFGIIKTLI
jgi:hypothetical protein